MSKLRPFMGPSRAERRANRPPPRIEHEEEQLFNYVNETGEGTPFTPFERAMVEIGLAQHRRMGEMIRHLQEIEGRTR